MKRPRSHVIEDESEEILKLFLPREWIIRKIPKDYGVDYEVEIVENGVVTGKRFWLQLKGTESITIRHTPFSNLDMTPKQYVAFQADTKLLKYSLRCDFPLLLGVVDVQQKQGFWLPLRDEIEANLEPRNPDWREQKTAMVRIPVQNSFSRAKESDYYGFRWYSMDLARMRALAILHHYYHELEYKLPMELSMEIDEEELIDILTTTKSYIKMALNLDCLFGTNGIDIFIIQAKPKMEAGLEACDEWIRAIKEGERAFLLEAALFGRVTGAVNLMSTCISMYKEFKWKFLFEEDGI